MPPRLVRIPAGHELCVDKHLVNYKGKTVFLNIQIFTNISSGLVPFPLDVEDVFCSWFFKPSGTSLGLMIGRTKLC